MTDSNLVARPGQIIRRVADEFEKLVLVTLMTPWHGISNRDDAVPDGEANESETGS